MGSFSLRTEDGPLEQTESGDPIFAASRVKTYTIEDIIAEHGERIPDHSQSQRDFRAAAVLLVDEDHPLVKWQLGKMYAAISAHLATKAPTNTKTTYNFYEATGGRATITLGGLSQFLKDGAPASLPGVPTDVTALANELQGIDLSWNAPASDGFSAITAYDLRYIESAADETEDSNWTVQEDVWTTGSGSLQYTVTGLTTGTEHDLQVRAVKRCRRWSLVRQPSQERLQRRLRASVSPEVRWGMRRTRGSCPTAKRS